ncbi:alpha/beta hydrolase family protein [Aestuariivivens sediminis]|uniref:alpha/beta hydrolase family protein n=1 Tax=Aestuariivivens sediminis TaxID=2913557 RepID=UPI001F560899|nr:alpha/beta hydrolase [Aestuariivivens sediminis]
MELRLFILYLCFQSILYSQNGLFNEKEISINRYIDGTLTLPNDDNDLDLVIIIGGSGPTDRNGNQNFLKNNALKKLSRGLVANGIATFRYDKRIVKQIRERHVDPNITFDDFITDAIAVIEYFKKTDVYNKIYILGHSQGSLVGMVASKDRVDGFISVAGAGQNIGDVLDEQISKTAPQFAEESKTIIEHLKKGELVHNYPQALASVFSMELQPFMINWMQYEPSQVITHLKIPILIANGTKDLQTSVEEAHKLKAAAPESTLIIIEYMNHVLVPIMGDDLENSKSYNEPYREISTELINSITTFIKSNH